MTANRIQLQVSVGIVSLEWREREFSGTLSYRASRIFWSPVPEQLTTTIPVVPGPVIELAGRIARYFENGMPIGEIPWNWVDHESWTPFQKAVYEAIAQIPHGETRTYGWVAGKIGKPKATRAVGQALRGNPLPILIPCHRVVSHDSLGGFMGQTEENAPEMQLKSALLEIEDRYRQPVFPLLAAV